MPTRSCSSTTRTTGSVWCWLAIYLAFFLTRPNWRVCEYRNTVSAALTIGSNMAGPGLVWPTSSTKTRSVVHDLIDFMYLACDPLSPHTQHLLRLPSPQPDITAARSCKEYYRLLLWQYNAGCCSVNEVSIAVNRTMVQKYRYVLKLLEITRQIVNASTCIRLRSVPSPT